ncbi:hypothetical protein AVEN_162997-1 [Araneus ventricosus]|uniref:Uncharacterized protein n=1 Tax=Araneus ventricosus TaxID=182803 RepID=A0A4Y2C1A3_ARAVE|nr:hypothetical protein AVEN_162997-1 [Araneus ventricosus]
MCMKMDICGLDDLDICMKMDIWGLDDLDICMKMDIWGLDDLDICGLDDLDICLKIDICGLDDLNICMKTHFRPICVRKLHRHYVYLSVNTMNQKSIKVEISFVVFSTKWWISFNKMVEILLRKVCLSANSFACEHDKPKTQRDSCVKFVI